MVKMAASEDGDRAASEIPDSCKKFWNATSAGMAELELLEQLEHTANEMVVVLLVVKLPY